MIYLDFFGNDFFNYNCSSLVKFSPVVLVESISVRTLMDDGTKQLEQLEGLPFGETGHKLNIH